MKRTQTERQVNPSTAPIFIAHGFADTVVPIAQSTALMEALGKARVKTVFLGFDGEQEFGGLSTKTVNAILDLEIDFIQRVPAR